MPGAGGGRDTHAVDGRMLQHRALADPSRVRLLERLRATRAAAVGGGLAAALGLHPEHGPGPLARARGGGARRLRPRAPGAAGPPARLFAAVPEEAEQEHALLAAALASSLEPLPDGADIAAAAGRSWGRVLVERLEPGRRARRGRVRGAGREPAASPGVRPGDGRRTSS